VVAAARQLLAFSAVLALFAVLTFLADEGTQDPELGRDRPRFQGRPLTQQAEHLVTGRARAAPLLA